ncbi:MAG: DNA primase [Tepidiformaceae bacterium]
MDAIEEIKRKLDLAEYIGRSVALQKSGRNFRGLCPFHTEKTPSFYVFPDSGNWRCFGSCGEGGDLFGFVKKRDSLEFREALRVLAAEAGVVLSAESQQRRGRQEQLAAIVSAGVDYYQHCLGEPGGEAARTYLLEKRGLKQDTIEAFHIGWAPDGWRGLRDHLLNRGYDERDVMAAGLLVEPEAGGNAYDRFRGRVIIPIRDERGQFVGMGGRGLQGEEPKYLNSPQSELFDKGRTLYGLDMAAQAIRTARAVVVVEGYMDVIGPWQAGFQNVVATMGTSLTEQHVSLLRRHARRVVLAMDPDAAGLAAAERAGGMFVAFDSPESMAKSARSADALAAGAGIDLRVAPLPAGKDPDEIAREDPQGWADAIAKAPPYAEFLLQRIMGEERPASPIEARQLVDRVGPVLSSVGDPVERSVYVQRVARHLGVTEEAVLERLRAARPGGQRRRAVGPANAEPATPEQMLLALLFRHPVLRREARSFPVDLFADALDREAFSRWVGGEEAGEVSQDDPVVLHVQRLEARRLPPLSEEEAGRAVRAKVREVLRERRILHQAALTEELAEAERELGVNQVAEVAAGAFRGERPEEHARAIAEAAMEEMELGLSIHRREEPWARSGA